ncbi:Dual specificity protein phosphatase 23 isoform 1 [Schistosoma japonicum]|uniref:Dual specificity protein phosphatase 23 isoform 1 n=1 Tax=Schistosoma japonicum TaxID=6182 RepID=A0A4Z2DNV5_SCHJA|nr:Dual specificity protein phosphatase 23 [Schistosoma japonicum]TNN18196.1 Dual specificity protein phosphatase 23 isoform 1 [Schistosoma japonicum]
MIALHTMLGILKKADMTKFRSLSKMFIRYIPSPSHYILSGFLQIYQRLNIAHYSVSFRRHFMTHPPANFSWVSKSVAGFAFPREKFPTYISDFKSVKHYHLPVEDLTAASLPVIQKAIEIIKQAEAKNEKVGVHCQLGRGRAGTILACYLAYKNNFDADDAIKELRRLRPKSIDEEQEKAVKQYVKSIKQL